MKACISKPLRSSDFSLCNPIRNSRSFLTSANFLLAVILVGFLHEETSHVQGETVNYSETNEVDDLESILDGAANENASADLEGQTVFKCYRCTSNEKNKDAIPYDPDCGLKNPKTTIDCDSSGCLTEHKGYSLYEKGCYDKELSSHGILEECFEKYTKVKPVFGKCNAGRVDIWDVVALQICSIEAPAPSNAQQTYRQMSQANIHVEFCHCTGDLCNSVNNLPFVGE